MPRLLWVVKGGQDGERQDFNLTHSVSTFGWAQLGDLSELGSRASIEDAIRHSLPSRPYAAVRNWSSQAFSFANQIVSGDLLAMPLKGTATVMFGEVTAGYTYDPGMLRDDARREMGPHLLQVQWNRAARESELDADLVVSLTHASQTVFHPRATEAESRIRAILSL